MFRFRSSFQRLYSSQSSPRGKVWTSIAAGTFAGGSLFYLLCIFFETLAQKTEKKEPTVVFVLGGPGAGKGTQCANLVRDFGFVHLSGMLLLTLAGDLLREEQNSPDSPFGELIKSYIKEGQIVPMEITIELLRNAMQRSGTDRFLIDGFPRKMDQALEFEKQVCPSKLVLYFECPEEEMLKRLLKRGQTSGRIDDNVDSIKKRFKTFRETSFPVIEHYDKQSKVKTVSCLNSVDGVYSETRKIFDQMFNKA